MIDIAILRAMAAAGASQEQIFAAIEADQKVQLERNAEKREKTRIRVRNHRSRNTSNALHALQRVTSVTPSPPPCPPSSLSPTPPITTTPLIPLPTILDGRDATRPLDRQFFSEFWKVYPKRDGSNPKAPAEKRFIAACKAGADPEAIIEGARRYAAKLGDKVGTPYVMQTLTWLSRQCWKDYASAQARDPGNPYLDPKHPQFDDYKHGWRPGMPTTAEIRKSIRERDNGKANRGNGLAPMDARGDGAGPPNSGLARGRAGERGGSGMESLFSAPRVDPNGRK